MYYVYSFEKFDYVSMHQNQLACAVEQSIVANCFDQEDSLIGTSEAKSVINQQITNELLASIITSTPHHTFLLWDARGIDFKPIHMLEKFSDLIVKCGYKCVVFVFESMELANLMKQEIIHNVTSQIEYLEIDELCFAYGCKPISELTDGLLDQKSIVSAINNGIKCYLFDIFKEEIDPETYKPHPIHSSNVYATRYFDAKKMFCLSSTLNLVIYQMAIILKDHFKKIDADFDAFVCASINGACLSSALSVLMKKPVIFLRNVGPNMKVNDERIVERLLAGKNYVFVFDFMCLGTEFQRVKMLCNIRRANINASIGISHYRLPVLRDDGDIDKQQSIHRKQEDIYTLFGMDDFTPYYKCFIDQEDCVSFMTSTKA